MAGFEFTKTPVSVPEVETQFRRIRTQLPAPGSEEIFNKLAQFESRSMHGQIPIVWDRAQDFSVWDHAGNRWIDFTSTIFLANAGHGNPRITEALNEVLKKDLLHSYTYATKIRADYLERLIKFVGAPFGKAFLLSAGTEATECAVKLMHMNGQKNGKRGNVVVSYEGSMHGRTLAAALMGGSPASRSWIGFDTPVFQRLNFPYYWELEEVGIDGATKFKQDIETLRARGVDPATDICGFLFESYIGWGAIFFPPDYIQAAAAFARENGILFGFDEIQSGFGRTGKLFAYEHYGVEPDFICVGKGMSSSLPLSAVIGRTEVMDLPDIGSMSSTHSANPLVCAAGMANIDVIEDENLVAEAARKGDLLHKALGALQARHSDRIKRVIGKGMVAALVLVDPVTGKPDADICNVVAEIAMQKGLILVHTGRESIKMGPPLTIPDEALLEGVDVLGQSLDEAIARQKG